MSKSFFKKHWGKIIYAILFLLMYPVAIVGSFYVGKAVGEKRFADLVEGNIASIINSDFPETSSNERADFTPFWKSWELLNQRFVHSTDTTTKIVDPQEKVWGAIQGLAASYEDPYTVFLPPDDKELFESDVIDGEFTGVGIEIGIRDGLLTVISPLSGTPASRAGIKAKDKVIAIDGVDSTNMSTNAAVQLIRGPKGEPVVLTVLREGQFEPLEISITRDTIQIPIIESEKKGDVFVIKLFSFSGKSASLFRDELQKFADSGSGKLILDLRGNPGGFLDAAVSMASWFLSEDKIIVSEDFEGKRQGREHYSAGYNVFKDKLPLIILTDAGSASASEILAGALRDYNKALLVGENTFGKGSVQELVDITPDTSLKVTIAKWRLPSGRHIDNDGLVPDILIKYPEDTNFEDEDVVLDEALKIINRSDFDTLFDTIPTNLQEIVIE